MERKEIEISKEELQSYIRDEVHKPRLSTAGTLMKYRLLQSLLQRRQTQATRFLKLCQSVVIFENTVKELYSQLGWEYTDLDSDSEDGEETTSCRRTLPFVFVSSGDRIRRPSASRDSTSQSLVSELEECQEEILSEKSLGVVLDKEAVVVLSKLTDSEISAAIPPLLSDGNNEHNLSSPESDSQWEPEKETSESDFSLSDFDTGSKKKRKINKNRQKHATLNPASKRSRMSSPKTRRRKRSTTTVKTPNYMELDVSGSSLPSTSDNNDGSSEEDAAALRSLSAKLTKLICGKTIKASQTTATVATKTQGKTTETRAQPGTTNTTSESSKTPSTQPSKKLSATTQPSKKSSETTQPPKKSSATTQPSKKSSETTQPPKKSSATTESCKKSSATTESCKKSSATTQPSKTLPSTTESSKTISAKTVVKTLTPPEETKHSSTSQQSSKTTVAPPSVPKGEIKVNTNVLARKQHLCWQRGKVAGIITKEGGKVKYKVTFEEKGKILVSGHHLAFDNIPKLDELSIGCRVVVKISNEKVAYKPGIMAELPNRRNRMRFLVYIDDHTPMYVGLPVLHLVYRALDNPLDDIPDEIHRNFMKDYLENWPYPPQTQFKVGQTIKADYEGVMQKCEVTNVDCSLVEVIFESDKHKEWLYRGSLRLEHMVIMRQSMFKMEAAESAKKLGSLKSTH